MKAIMNNKNTCLPNHWKIHINSPIRSPSRLYYKLRTENNLFHAFLSKQRKFHLFHLGASTAANSNANSCLVISMSPWHLPCTSHCTQPAGAESRAGQDIALVLSKGQHRCWLSAARLAWVQAHLSAKGKLWLLRHHAAGLCMGRNASLVT